MISTNLLNHRSHLRICNVFAIPSKKVIHTIYSGNCNVISINFSANRNRAFCN